MRDEEEEIKRTKANPNLIEAEMRIKCYDYE
jgi:hypothetical protein